MRTVSGSYGPIVAGGKSYIVGDTFTAPADGMYVFTHEVFYQGAPDQWGTVSIVTPNDNFVASLILGTEFPDPIEGFLAAGDVVEFAITMAGSTVTGTWSVTSDALSPPLPANAFTPDGIEQVLFGADEVDSLHYGNVELWSSGPSLALFAEFNPGSLLANSGADGGQFAHTGASLGERPPYGAWFPSTSVLSAPVQRDGRGYTVAGWVKSSKKLEDVIPIALSDPGNATMAYLRIVQSSDATRRIYLLSRHGGDRPPSIISPTYAGTGRWLHVAAVLEYAQSGASVHLYVNGSLVGSESLPISGNYMEGATLSLGNDWEGDMGLVRLYRGTLGPQEVRGLFDNERGIYGLPENPDNGNPVLWLDPDVWLAFDKDLLTNRGALGNATIFSTPNPVRSVTGQGRVASFTGGTLQVPISNRPWPSGGTIACWFLSSSGNSNGGKGIIHRGTTGSIRWELYLNTDPATGRLYAGAKINNTWWDVALPVGTINVADGNWHYIAATVGSDPFNTSRWTLSVYADGHTNSVTRSGLISTGAFPNDGFLLGGTRDGTRYRCLLDDVIMLPRQVPASTLNEIRDYGRSDPTW